jgi:hypothetical protein
VYTESMFYVYELVDPRDGKVFYIGKGQGERAWRHESDVRAGTVGNNWNRFHKIKAIIASDLAVEVRIVKEFDVESEAYNFEMILISSTPGLTNISSGGEIMRHMFKRPKRADKHVSEINEWLKKAKDIAAQIEADRQIGRKEARLPKWVKRGVRVEFVGAGCPFTGSFGKVEEASVADQTNLVVVRLMGCGTVVRAPLDWIRWAA